MGRRTASCTTPRFRRTGLRRWPRVSGLSSTSCRVKRAPRLRTSSSSKPHTLPEKTAPSGPARTAPFVFLLELEPERPPPPRRHLTRPQHDPHRTRLEIELPGRDPRADEVLVVASGDRVRRGVQKLQQPHTKLEVGAALPGRRDADAGLVLELPDHEPLRHAEQPLHDQALQLGPVPPREAPRQRPHRTRTAQLECQPPPLRRGPARRRRGGVLGTGTGGQIVAVQPEEFRHRRVQIAPTGRGGPPPAGDQVGDEALRHLHRGCQLTRRAVQLPETSPEKLTDGNGVLDRRGCSHATGSFENEEQEARGCIGAGRTGGWEARNIAQTGLERQGAGTTARTAKTAKTASYCARWPCRLCRPCRPCRPLPPIAADYGPCRRKSATDPARMITAKLNHWIA